MIPLCCAVMHLSPQDRFSPNEMEWHKSPWQAKPDHDSSAVVDAQAASREPMRFDTRPELSGIKVSSP